MIPYHNIIPADLDRRQNPASKLQDHYVIFLHRKWDKVFGDFAGHLKKYSGCVIVFDVKLNIQRVTEMVYLLSRKRLIYLDIMKVKIYSTSFWIANLYL